MTTYDSRSKGRGFGCFGLFFLSFSFFFFLDLGVDVTDIYDRMMCTYKRLTVRYIGRHIILPSSSTVYTKS